MTFQTNGVSSKNHNYFEASISFIKRIYVLFWHNLSLDPRVRASPYDPPPENEVKMETWPIVYYRFFRVFYSLIHVTTLITIICGLRGMIKIQTIIFGVVCVILSAVGTLIGSHRYWSHKSFTATPSLELFLIFCHSMSAQLSVFSWARLHRVHHKFSDTVADPHNANAGMFFSQIGWQLIQGTPECRKAVKEVWVDDLRKHKVVMLHHKYWGFISVFVSYYLPSAIPYYFWNETLLLSIGVAFARFLTWIHLIGTVNSLGHYRGMRPFDRTIQPTDHLLLWLTTFGDEGWHNYHHAFPSDYKASEFWGYKSGLGTLFIELCARLGLAYNLKTTPPEVTMKRRQRTGDLSCNIEDWINPHIHFEKKNMSGT